MQKKLTFKISKKTGEIEAETHGFDNNQCVEELNFLKQISGDDPSVDYKEEGQPNYATTID